MDIKIIKYFFLIFILFIHGTLSGLTLPVKDAKVTSTFGETRQDHFHNGVDFGGGEQDVLAVRDGKIVFYSDRREFPFTPYMGSGNYVILKHRENQRTYYMHLKNGSINKTNYEVKEGTCLGRTSDTGHSYGIHLHFSMEKEHPLEILNPLKFFKDQLTDAQKPRIEAVLASVDEGPASVFYDTLNLRDGEFVTLFIRCADYWQNDSIHRLAPYRITCEVNGEKLAEYVFDRLIVKNNYYYLPPNFSFEDIYGSKEGIRLGRISLNRKQYDITITVEDLFGNQAKTGRRISVQK